MRKVLMLSIIAATVGIPAVAARSQRPGAAFSRLLFAALIFNLAYALVVMFATPAVSVGE